MTEIPELYIQTETMFKFIIQSFPIWINLATEFTNQ